MKRGGNLKEEWRKNMEQFGKGNGAWRRENMNKHIRSKEGKVGKSGKWWWKK